MDGQRKRLTMVETPIAKPDFPLPMIFNPAKLAELPTNRNSRNESLRNQRAYFYLKDVNEYGSPVYDFVITTEEPEVGREH